jgi:hypothetical protein
MRPAMTSDMVLLCNDLEQNDCLDRRFKDIQDGEHRAVSPDEIHLERYWKIF